MYDATQTDPSRQHPGVRHEPWCDLQQHTLTEASGYGFLGCVGRSIDVGPEIGGWISIASGEPRIVVDWPGHGVDGEYTRQQALELAAFFATAVAELDRRA